MGMIGGATPKTGFKQNPLIQQAEAKIESTVKPEMRNIYEKIVTRAIQFATTDKAHAMLFGELKNSKDPVKDVALGAVGILLILFQKSNRTMPMDIMPAAGMALVLQGLAFVEPMTGIKITKEDIDNAHTIFMANLLPKIGITPEILQKAREQAATAEKNPQIMAQYRASTGAKK